MWNPPDPKTYFAVVWTIVRQIPAGQVSTYGQIAMMIPPPEGIAPPDYERLGSRWVGTAMNNTPPGEGIPWQRVINSKGTISLPPGSPGAREQRALLEGEGVEFDSRGHVDFNAVGWNGPPEEWLQAHGLYRPYPLRKNAQNPPEQPRLL